MRTTDLDDDTLSKIDVDTMEVVGRYRTSHGLGGAYAVSIGLNGDIVATSLAVDLDRPGGRS